MPTQEGFIPCVIHITADGRGKTHRNHKDPFQGVAGTSHSSPKCCLAGQQRHRSGEVTSA